MGFLRRSAAFAAAVALAVPLAVAGAPAASAQSCAIGMRTSFHALGGPFTGGTTLTWSVKSTCAEVAVTLNGSAVGRQGAMTVHPKVSTNYELRVNAGGTTTKAVRTAIAGKVMGYVRGPKGLWLDQEGVGPGIEQARRVSGRLLSALAETQRARFAGKVLEIHIIPGETFLTNLRPFTELERTGGVADRPWREVRGAGGLVIEGTNRVAVAVGAEELGDTSSRPQKYGNGYMVAHELAHAIMNHMAPASLRDEVERALTDRGESADYLGDDGYTKSNADEYWAETSAALFEYEYGSQFDAEYNEGWLAGNDSRMHRITSRVFANR